MRSLEEKIKEADKRKYYEPHELEKFEAKKTGSERSIKLPSGIELIRGIYKAMVAAEKHKKLPKDPRNSLEMEAIRYYDTPAVPFYYASGYFGKVTYVAFSPLELYLGVADANTLEDWSIVVPLVEYQLKDGQSIWLPKTRKGFEISVYEIDGEVYVGTKDDISLFLLGLEHEQKESEKQKTLPAIETAVKTT